MPPMDPDELVQGCGRAAAAPLRELLGDDLVAAYLIGSGALGGVSAVQSDVDVVAVCAAPLPGAVERGLAARLCELAMTWPLRGLEFVLYTRVAVADPARVPGWELNLTVGPRMDHHLSRDPVADPPHWFVLDLDILRGHGRTLADLGPGAGLGAEPDRRPAHGPPPVPRPGGRPAPLVRARPGHPPRPRPHPGRSRPGCRAGS